MFFKSKCFLIVILSSINLSIVIVNSMISLAYLIHSPFNVLFSSLNADNNGDIFAGSNSKLTSSNLYCFHYANLV